MTGDEFEKTRKMLGLTQGELASKMGISAATVAVCEKAQVVRLKYVAKIAALYEKGYGHAAGLPSPYSQNSDSDILTAYKALSDAAATLYRLAKQSRADMRAKPVGRPPLDATAREVSAQRRASDTRLARDINAAIDRNRERDLVRPQIAACLATLERLPTEEARRDQISLWIQTTEQGAAVSPFVRDFYLGLGAGDILLRSDPRITLPHESIK